MTDPMSPDDLKACRERAEAATPGPWTSTFGFNNGGIATGFFAIPGHNGGERVEMILEDAVFIVRARADVPRLLATVAARDAQLEAVADVLSAHGCDCECGCDSDGHDDDCEPCLGCRIEAAMKGASR